MPKDIESDSMIRATHGWDHYNDEPDDEGLARFDAWLADHDEKIRAEQRKVDAKIARKKFSDKLFASNGYAAAGNIIGAAILSTKTKKVTK